MWEKRNIICLYDSQISMKADNLLVFYRAVWNYTIQFYQIIFTIGH